MIRPELIRRKPLKHDRLLAEKAARRVAPVTVCIVARSLGNLVGVSDRMLTSGDIQFEPATTPKLAPLTNSIAILQSGDAALNTEITMAVSRIVIDRIESNRSEWWLTKDVADLYVQQRNIIKNRRAEATMLAPLGLTIQNYRDEIRKYGDDNAQQLMRDIINFDLPHTAVIIISGIDPTGAHIYVVDDGDINCNDSIGFAAVGIGARHAESQLMFARYSPTMPIVDAALLAFIAKKRAEVAPGVGRATDMFTAGPTPGSLITLQAETVAGFEAIYNRLIEKEGHGLDEARQEANEFIARATEQTAERAGEQQEQPSNEAAPAPPDTERVTPRKPKRAERARSR